VTFRRRHLLGAAVAMAWSCSSDGSVASSMQGGSGGSVPSRQVLSNGSLGQVGSSDPQSSVDENPGWIRFAHDYWLDATEVTQAEYQALMGRNPSPTASSSPSMPVVNLTWYDAVLFCNARSKRDHLDTVYEYSVVSKDSTGSVWCLAGLASHLERDGWRLPSEAEWENAARAGSRSPYPWGDLGDSGKAAEYAWFQRNAGGRLHEVARLKPNPWGFYDMAGNAMEWVQDWKGTFPKDTVTDFVGPDGPSDVAETPLKSGSYAYGLEHLRPSSRTATYAAYRTAKAEYVGFRCARGGFAPTYSNSSGQMTQAPPVSILHSDVNQILGASASRLVFLNRSNGKSLLSWIDFGEALPVVRGLPDADPVFHPVISPDGKWVAWCTAMEGSVAASRIKARRLTNNDTSVLDLGPGAIPRWWVDGVDTFLIRTATALDNTGPAWSVDRTLAQRWSRGALVGSTETWSGTGGYHDGRSGQFLYTGYRRLKQYALGSDASRTLFASPQNGKRSGDTSQVCNVSAAPDATGRVLFLDFGYAGVSTLLGRPYGIHEVAFVADSLGNVVKTFPVAMGKSQWNHLEWSNDSRWAAGMALENNGASKEIHLLDLASGANFPLAKGDELWMPQLWVSAPVIQSNSTTDPDSSGAYAKKVDYGLTNFLGDGVFNLFAAKLAVYWPVRESLEVAFVGASRVQSGFVPSEFHSGKSFNFGIAANELYGDERVIRDYLLVHSKRLKVVVLGLMPGWFVRFDGITTGNATWPSLANSVGYRYDQNHGFWAGSLPSGFLDAVRSKRTSLAESLAPSGEEFVPSGKWSGVAPIDVTSDGTLQSQGYLTNIRKLNVLVDDLSKKGIKLLLVNFPVNPNYRYTSYAETYGPRWPVYNELLDTLKKLEKSYPNYRLYDANRFGNHDYVSGDAQDDGHLATQGAIKLTRRIDSLLVDWK